MFTQGMLFSSQAVANTSTHRVFSQVEQAGMSSHWFAHKPLRLQQYSMTSACFSTVCSLTRAACQKLRLNFSHSSKQHSRQPLQSSVLCRVCTDNWDPGRWGGRRLVDNTVLEKSTPRTEERSTTNELFPMDSGRTQGICPPAISHPFRGPALPAAASLFARYPSCPFPHDRPRFSLPSFI